jgi:hypothetical protein
MTITICLEDAGRKFQLFYILEYAFFIITAVRIANMEPKSNPTKEV